MRGWRNWLGDNGKGKLDGRIASVWIWIEWSVWDGTDSIHGCHCLMLNTNVIEGFIERLLVSAVIDYPLQSSHHNHIRWSGTLVVLADCGQNFSSHYLIIKWTPLEQQAKSD